MVVVSADETAVSFYGRDLLLLGANRNSLLDLWEILRYGTDSFGDANYLSIYGLRPDDWYARGVRLLGRTAVSARRTMSPVLLPDIFREAVGFTTARTICHRPVRWFGQHVVLDTSQPSRGTWYWMRTRSRSIPTHITESFDLRETTPPIPEIVCPCFLQSDAVCRPGCSEHGP